MARVSYLCPGVPPDSIVHEVGFPERARHLQMVDSPSNEKVTRLPEIHRRTTILHYIIQHYTAPCAQDRVELYRYGV